MSRPLALATLLTLPLAACASTGSDGGAAVPRFEELEDALVLARWTEGVEAADVDNDGDHDLFLADGPAFVRPGPKQQNQLVINRLDEAVPTLSNESVLRLGRHESHAKMVVTGDVDGDGWVDALFCNAFRTDPPSLFVNRGASEPGYFDLESAERGLTEPLNSGSGQFGDLDDDGDLDLVLCDSGEHLLFGEGGVPRLFFNDGRGRFTERADRLPLPPRRAHVDVQLADLDGDFDLDLLVPCRAEAESGPYHYLALNDGTGRFEDASELVPNGSGNVYEIEVGDLDGDNDLDLFFVSLAGYSEGPALNRLAEDGALSFEPGPTLGDLDDNELALLDWDADGDLDVVVGSLAGAEKWLRNDGGLAFVEVACEPPGVADPTLDLTVVDLDGDGRYDLVTAQGEGDPRQYVNRVYLGRGPRDVRPPRVAAESAPTFRAEERAFVLRARVQDDVVDDGQDWVRVTGRFRVDGGPWRAARTTRSGGGLWRIALPLEPGEGADALVEYDYELVDGAGNRARTATRRAR